MPPETLITTNTPPMTVQEVEAQRIDLWFPPMDGYPRLKYMYLEVLWCLSRSMKPRFIAEFVGCSVQYVWIVKNRFSKKSEGEVLEIYKSICEEWPDEF